jgi:protein-disulfide isomerase
MSLVVLVIYSAVRPGGRLQSYLAVRQSRANATALAQDHWDAVAQTAARLGTGDSSAPPSIVEFGDYECPFCTQSHPQLQAILESHPDITIGFRHFPMRGHPKAHGAARAAICAEVQGRFEEMHSVLFEVGDWRIAPEENWTPLAARAGVPNLADFENCLIGNTVEQRLADDLRWATQFGVTAIPTYVYRYGVHVGYLTEEQLIRLVSVGRGPE